MLICPSWIPIEGWPIISVERSVRERSIRCHLDDRQLTLRCLFLSSIPRCTWGTMNSENSSTNSTNNVVKVKPPGTDLLLSPPVPEDHLLPATTTSPRLPDRPVLEATINNRILPRRILTDRLALSRPSCPTTETRSYLATGTRGNERLTNCRMLSGRTKRGESPRESRTVHTCFLETCRL